MNKNLMAKTDPENRESWLPLWMHLSDTAGVMKKLIEKWLPYATISATQLADENFKKCAVFVAAIHDIGKATSYFQSIITKDNGDKRFDIIQSGYDIRDQYLAAGKTPHASAGQWILQSDVTGFGLHEDIANIVGAHHGRPISAGNLGGQEDLLKTYPVNFYGTEISQNEKEIWQETWKEIIEMGLQISGLDSIAMLPELNIQAQVLLSGLLIIADWIASNVSFFPLISIDEYGNTQEYPARIEAGWRKISFPEIWQSGTYQMDEEMFFERFHFSPNEVQKAVYEIINTCEKPGIFILEAQMGVGKTEAALSGAEVLAAKKQDGGIFFGLPTQATSNGLFDRLLSWGNCVSDDTVSSIRLAHNAAQFNEEYSRLALQGKTYVNNVETAEGGLEVHPWFQGNKKALLADFVLGTVDQFLMAGLRKKHFMLRHIGLAGKVVVIDECHAYDTYMNQYLERSLEWMAAYGVPVILLSATLPSERRYSLVRSYVKAYCKYNVHDKSKLKEVKEWKSATGYPLLTWSDGAKIGQQIIQQEVLHKQIEIQKIFSVERMMQQIDESLNEGGCACIIANTVKSAQTIYSYAIEHIKDAKIVLYHAQYTMPDRAEKEKCLLQHMGKMSTEKDRNRFILIGTQVLEQSLDYDADIMVTQLCPIDLLLQRIGRLHRHSRIRPGRLLEPQCIILQESEDTPYDGGTKKVYGGFLLNRTETILPDKIDIPSDIPMLVQKVYDISDDLGMKADVYKDDFEAFFKEREEKKSRAEAYLLDRPSGRTMKGILSNANLDNNSDAGACVRDGVSSIEVLLMKQGKGGIYFIQDTEDGDRPVLSNRIPTEEEGRKIAKQRLHLPYIFCTSWNADQVIRELENRNRQLLSMWQQSPWLKGELILLLDADQKTELIGYQLQYTREQGLQYIHKEDSDAG